MPYMKDNVISKSYIEDGIEITDAKYQELFKAKLDGKIVSVRNGNPFIYSGNKRDIYRLNDGAIQVESIYVEDDTPEGWQDTEPTPEPINYTTASKLKILAYLDAQGETVRNQFLAVLKSDDFLYEQWLAANEIDISHPAIPTVRDAMDWTQQQVQELFNALNTQQA